MGAERTHPAPPMCVVCELCSRKGVAAKHGDTPATDDRMVRVQLGALLHRWVCARCARAVAARFARVCSGGAGNP